MHLVIMYKTIGVRGIEPPTYASQKRRATSALHPVDDALIRMLAMGHHTQHSDSLHRSKTQFPL